MAKASPSLPTPSHGRKLTIGFGMVNVAVAMKSLVENARPIAGKGLCPEHGPSLASVSLCSRGSDHEHVVDNAEKLTGYPHPDDPGRLVVVDAETVKSLSEATDGVGTIKRTVDASSIDSAYTEKAFLLYPQTGHEQAFDLLAAALREGGKAALVDVVLYKQTETLAVRWHAELDVLVAETIRFEQKIRHEDAELVRAGAEARGPVNEEMLAVASTILESLDGVFDAGEAQDTWTPLMQQAIRAADKGETFDAPVVAEPEKVVDLMEALKASVDQATPKKKAAAKPKTRKKVAA